MPATTYEKWLAGIDLPPGFTAWEHAHRHYEQGDPIEWAIHCFKQLSRKKRRILQKREKHFKDR